MEMPYVFEFGMRFRPRGGDEELCGRKRFFQTADRALCVQAFPEDLGNVGNKGMEEPQDLIEG